MEGSQWIKSWVQEAAIISTHTCTYTQVHTHVLSIYHYADSVEPKVNKNRLSLSFSSLAPVELTPERETDMN